MPVQYTVIFMVVRIDNFQMKIFDIFLIFAHNIDYGYRLWVHIRTEKLMWFSGKATCILNKGSEVRSRACPVFR